MASIFTNIKNNLLNFRNNVANVRYEHSGEIPTTRANHKVKNLERKFLVWTGKYKRVEDVPDFVEQNVVERARNRMRIRIANYMIVTIALGCFLMVYLGKQDAKKGESVTQWNLDWHQQNQKANKEKSS